jgi:hypothetical protein
MKEVNNKGRSRQEREKILKIKLYGLSKIGKVEMQNDCIRNCKTEPDEYTAQP